MIYFFSTIGLLLIFISTMVKKKEKDSFSTIVDATMKTKNIEVLEKDIKDLENRVEELESSFLLLNSELRSNYKVEVTSNLTSDISVEENIINNTVSYETPEAETAFIDKNAIIYELFDKGKSIDDIASQTEIGKGEILLRLGMRKSKK